MGWLPTIERKAPPPAEPAASDKAGGNVRRVPYSPQYQVIVGQGHDHPTPFFSAPALIWHIGVWPLRESDPHGNPTEDGKADPPKDAQASIRNLGLKFRQRRSEWIAEINGRLASMQTYRRRTTTGDLPAPKLFKADKGVVPDSGSIVFTMWWGASDTPGGIDDSAIRVKVHCNLTPDYATYSLYMDVGTFWGGTVMPAAASTNPHRVAIEKAVGDIARICHPPKGDKAPDSGLPHLAGARSTPRYAQVHHDHLDPVQDAALLAARNMLYVDAWERFSKATGCSFEAMAGQRSEVFANFRGVVLGVPSMGGFEPATKRFPRFSEDARFNRDGTEANGVVDAYWPLVRRIVPHADFREFVVCGLLNWRALYVTALGSPAQYDVNEERPATLGDKTEADIRVDTSPGTASARSGSEPWDSCVRRQYGNDERNNHPVRYLMLTKENLNPRQLGRIAERINALGTLRLYALKDWSTIVEADTTIRILGQELDQITRKWSEMRNALERYQTMRDFQQLVKRLRSGRAIQSRNSSDPSDEEQLRKVDEDERKLAPYIRNVDVPGRIRWFLSRVRTLVMSVVSLELGRFSAREEASRVIDIKYGILAEISRELESCLIEIGAELDRQGVEVVGGLHFRVNRSAVHVAEFRHLLKLLQIGNIQTWTSYEQFVERGLEPAFAYIRSVGTRIHSLRERLIAVLETIETSALVGQSSATRHNTGELRRIMTYVLIFIAFYLVLNQKALIDTAHKLLTDFGSLFEWSQIQRLLEALFARQRL